MRKLTVTALKAKAMDTARGGARASAAGITYAQAAERALENAASGDVEQLARWWIREKLDAGMFLATEWCGELEDLPLEVARPDAARVVARAAELWSGVVLDALHQVAGERTRD